MPLWRRYCRSARCSRNVPHFEVNAVEVPSGVAGTPLSREAMMEGAKQRDRSAARPQATPRTKPGNISSGWKADSKWCTVPNGRLGVSGELGLCDGWHGEGSFGQSGAVLLPDALAKVVVDDGVELSDAIDAFATAKGSATRRALGAC